MKNKTKQIITSLTVNVLFVPPIYFSFYSKGRDPGWLLVFLSFLPIIIALVAFRIIWGADCLKKSAWQEEGYTSFKEWFKESQTTNGKFFRFNLKIVFPCFLIFSLFAGIIFVVLK